jgi:tetratricopeptide (TPR) repeat protein
MKLCLATVIFFLAASHIHGATVVLKSGEVVYGEIVSDTNGVVQVEVSNASHSIFSIRSIQHSDIKEIPKESADESAYQQTLQYKLTDSSRSTAYYDKVITDVFQPFLASYPSSVYSKVIADKLKQWTDERDRVDAGAVKWKGQWYLGEDVQKVAGVVKAAQLVDEGDRQRGLGHYETAINKYREAIAIRPLQASYLQEISTKASLAGQNWKDTVSAAGSQLTAAPQDFDRANEDLQTKRAALQQSLNNDLAHQNLLLSAKTKCVQYGKGGVCITTHWVAHTTVPIDGKRDFDFGSVLPDPHSYDADIQYNRNGMATIDTQIAANIEKKSSLRTQAVNSTSQFQVIDSLLGLFANELQQARSDALRLEADERVRPVPVPTRFATSTVLSQPDPGKQEAPPLPVESKPTLPTVAQLPAPVQPPQDSWLDSHLSWVFATAFGLIVVWRVRRQMSD